MSKPGAMQDLKALVRLQAEEADLCGRRILVAVSGGPDSVALFHLLARLSAETGMLLHLCHVDHGWRPETAAHEAGIARELAVSAGVGWSVVHLPAPAAPSEAQARTARLSALERVAAGIGAAAIALGHQADDQAETILMQLVRGAAVAGGMAAWRPPLWRPLLSVPRAALRQYCRDEGLSFADDPSNSSFAFERNRMRHAVLPLLRRENPRVVEALARFAFLRAEEDAWLEEQAAGIVASLPRVAGSVDLRPLRRYARPLQRRALRQAIGQYGIALGADRLLACQQALETDGRYALARHVQIERGFLWRAAPPLPWSALLPGARVRWSNLLVGVGPPPEHALQAEVGEGRLSVRSRRPGDRLRLAGGSRKLQDILVDAKVPRPLRDALPVICVGGRPVWLPGHVRAVDAGSGTTVWVGSADVVAQLWSVLE